MLINLYRRKYQVFAGLSILYIIFSLLLIELTVTLFTDYHTRSVKDDIESHIAVARSNFEASIYHDIYVADSLSTLVTIEPNFAIAHWNAISEKIVSKANSVRNIVLAPNDVMTYVYPLHGNEKVIGVAYQTLPEQMKKVMNAREHKEMILDGPVNLVQGGTGMIARYPIFSDSPHNTQYWGVISVVLDYDKLVEQAGLVTIPGSVIAIEKPSGDENALIFGSQDTIEQADIKFPIHLPNNEWTLYATYQNDYLAEDTPEIITVARTAGIVAFLSGYILLVLLFRSYLELYKTSIQDELTRIPNRRFILNQLDRMCLKSNTSFEFTLLSMDMNDFKAVNDAYGHEAGDALLKHVTKLLSNGLRASDTICRFGGDEFVILLHRISSEKAVTKIISKLHDQLDSHPLLWNGLQLVPSVSIGYAVHTGKLTHNRIRELLARADKRMYEEKSTR